MSGRKIVLKSSTLVRGKGMREWVGGRIKMQVTNAGNKYEIKKAQSTEAFNLRYTYTCIFLYSIYADYLSISILLRFLNL